MPLESLKRNFFQQNDIVSRLILINVIVFFISWFGGSILEWFHLQAYGVMLYEHTAISSEIKRVLLNPWTFISYQFMHANLFHIFWNMYILFIFGRFFKGLLNKSRFLTLFLLSGISGAVLFLLAYSFIPLLAERGGGYMVGASAAVMGVVAGAAVLYPNLELHLLLFGRVKLKWLAVAILILSSYDITGSNAGGSLSHFGGALVGALLMSRFKKGKDDLIVFPKALTSVLYWFFKPKSSKFKVRYKAKVGMSKATEKEAEIFRQQKIDSILDKISKSGFDSLTEKERDFLSNISED